MLFLVSMSGKTKVNRKELSSAEKVNVINKYEKTDKSQRVLAEQFGVGKTQIQKTIKRQAEYLIAFEDNTASSHTRSCPSYFVDKITFLSRTYRC